MVFSSAFIGLREGLEAALIISILAAFLVKSQRRGALRWVWLGVGSAILLSIAIGAILAYTTAQLSFEHQELLGGTLSIVAVIFVTTMIFWMRKAGAHMATELRDKMRTALEIGPLAILLLSFLAVGREGLETAVFFYATVQKAQSGTTQPLLGFAAGILVAVILAYLLYRGAIRFNLSKFFTITGVFLVFIAAGVLGYGLHDLQEAAFLPGLNTIAFDTSQVLPETSWLGTLIKGIFNYSQQTTVLQAIVWLGYVAIVLPLFLRSKSVSPKRKSTPNPSDPTKQQFAAASSQEQS